ncbi:hypothetical protein [Ensifer adhaerens]
MARESDRLVGSSSRIDELVGIAGAFVADGNIDKREVEFLKKWLTEAIDSDEQRILRHLYRQVIAHPGSGGEANELTITLQAVAARDFSFAVAPRPTMHPELATTPTGPRISQVDIDKMPKGRWGPAQRIGKQASGTKSRDMAGMSLIIVAAISLAAALFFSRDKGEKSAATNLTQSVTSSQFGADWPFPFAEAALTCENKSFGETDRPLVTLKNGDQVWGLNGAAIGVAGYLDHRVLLPRDPVSGAFLKGINTVQELLRIGLALCER